MKTKYSPMEEHLHALLPDDGRKISTTDLAKAYYGRIYKKKKAPDQTVTERLKSLARKARANCDNFVVKSTQHAGPYPMQHWIEHKK